MSNSTGERLCERKSTNCELGSPLCLTIMINDVPRRSHQNVNLFAAPPRRTARFGIGLLNGSLGTTTDSDDCGVKQSVHPPVATRPRA